MQDLDEFSATEAALAQMAATPNPRLKEIIDAAVRHLHAFARDVNLTPEEWLAGIGFLTGIVVSTGPISVPVFTAYGLTRGAFIATEAAGSLALYISKAATFRSLGALPVDVVLKGLIAGSSVMVGTYTARLVVERLSIATFQRLLDGVMLISGLALLYSALYR